MMNEVDVVNRDYMGDPRYPDRRDAGEAVQDVGVQVSANAPEQDLFGDLTTRPFSVVARELIDSDPSAWPATVTE
jgi:hypothetical protein